MRTMTTFKFLPGTTGHEAHGDKILTAHKILRDLPGGGVVVNLAEGFAYTRGVRPNEIEIVTEPPAPYRCEHCNIVHGPAHNILVTVTNCPGTLADGTECEHETCTELDDEALCFEDDEDAMAYALERSAAHPLGAAKIYSVHTAYPTRDVTECWAVVVDGAMLGDDDE